MTATTVLVTGAGGQLGHDTCAAFERAGWRVLGLSRAQLDVGDERAVADAVAKAKPDVIANTAAFTAVDDCESQPQRAFRDNRDALRWLRRAADATGSHLIHISTDYVFDGTKPAPYIESDQPNPTSVYGRSKWEGEIEAGDGATIVRTSWVFGEHGHNMVKTVLRLAADPDRPLAFVDDQRGCPTFTVDLAGALVTLAQDRTPGIYHLTNARAVSWFEFAAEILSAAGLDAARVTAIATADLHPPRPAPRPANSVLDNAAWRAAGRAALPDHGDALGRLMSRIR